MPGTPATSPRFGAPRYSDADTADFAASVNPIVDAFDKAAKNLIPTPVSANHNAADAELVVVTANSPVITLPAHSAGQLIGVINLGSGIPTINGTDIQGKGLASASAFPLGSVGAKAVLLDDGTNWLMIEGEQDSGLVANTLHLCAATAGAYALSHRLRGDVVGLSGSVTVGGAGVNAFDWIATGMPVPAESAYVTPAVVTGGTPDPQVAFEVGSTASGYGGLLISRYAGGYSLASGVVLGFDGLSYRLV